jgi:transcriptional regulator with XRE-family HTH domain
MSQPDEETIGQRLRRVRRERGLSQTELSGDGVSTSYVSYLERDRRVASHKALRVLGNKLGVSAEYLETGETTSGRDTSLLDAELELRLGSVEAAVPRFEEALEHAGHSGTRKLRHAPFPGSSCPRPRSATMREPSSILNVPQLRRDLVWRSGPRSMQPWLDR